MVSHYNQNYSTDDITSILNKIKYCIQTNTYTIALNDNRQENRNFISDYNIKHNKQRLILLQIKLKDFCHSLQNTNMGFEHEILYVFAPKVKLFNIDGIEETVIVYTKFN